MSDINHSAANQILLGASPPLVLDFDLSKSDLGAPIALKAEVPAPGWLPGDELHREAYELVRAGVVWREACRCVGVDYTAAQHRYRLRGLPSPVRTFPPPAFGTREHGSSDFEFGNRHSDVGTGARADPGRTTDGGDRCRWRPRISHNLVC